MQNIGSIINSHNKKVLESKTEKTKPCNCRQKDSCPLAGRKISCRTENVIYKAEVKTENERKTYIGLGLY